MLVTGLGTDTHNLQLNKAPMVQGIGHWKSCWDMPPAFPPPPLYWLKPKGKPWVNHELLLIHA